MSTENETRTETNIEASTETPSKKKPRRPHSKSKAAQIRRLLDQGYDIKHIAERVRVPVSYVYVIRSKTKSVDGENKTSIKRGLPTISTRYPMPVPGGIQTLTEQTATENKKTWWERVKSWFA